MNGKHIFVVEHEYPLLIPKKRVIENGWDLETLKSWMYSHAKITIITRDEDSKLVKTASTNEIAFSRYSNANIEIVEFDE